MACIEGQQPNSESEKGKNWRDVGLGILVVGLLGQLALLVGTGVIVAAGGEIYRRAHNLEQK